MQAITHTPGKIHGILALITSTYGIWLAAYMIYPVLEGHQEAEHWSGLIIAAMTFYLMTMVRHCTYKMAGSRLTLRVWHFNGRETIEFSLSQIIRHKKIRSIKEGCLLEEDPSYRLGLRLARKPHYKNFLRFNPLRTWSWYRVNYWVLKVRIGDQCHWIAFEPSRAMEKILQARLGTRRP